MPASTHLRNRQARHWFRWVLSTTQLPSDLALHTYCLFRRIDRCKDKHNDGLVPVPGESLLFEFRAMSQGRTSTITLKKPAQPSQAKMP